MPAPNPKVNRISIRANKQARGAEYHLDSRAMLETWALLFFSNKRSIRHMVQWQQQEELRVSNGNKSKWVNCSILARTPPHRARTKEMS